MCLATPLKITKIEKNTASVDHEGKTFEVSLMLVPTANVGDWVLAHGKMAISKIPEKDAHDILRLIKTSEQKS